MESTLFILGRVVFGVYFAWSGLNHFINMKAMTGYAASKKIPSPEMAVMGTGLLLLLGGLGMALNINMRMAAILLLIFLIPTTFLMHAFWNDHDAMAKMGNRVNFMKNCALIGALLMILG